MIDIERERKRFLDWWWTTHVGDPQKTDEWIWLAAKEQAANEIEKNLEYTRKLARCLKPDIDLAQLANGGAEFRKDYCTCDPSVGMAPCQYCAIFDALRRTMDLCNLLLTPDPDPVLVERVRKDAESWSGGIIDEVLTTLDATKEIAALREYAEQQCCECYDEWGNPKPHRCHRCRVLHVDNAGEKP